MEPIAYLDGEYVPAAAARLPVYDLGVVGGVAVSEMLRTFRHQPFRVDSHLARLEQSLKLVGLEPQGFWQDLPDILVRVVEHNTKLVETSDDVGVIVFVTAGWNSTYVGAEAAVAHGCTVGVHTFPLQYRLWADSYEAGVRLATSSVPALPGSVVDRRVKSRSRMHWHLANRDVKVKDPRAVALLLDDDGSVTETASSNVCAVIDGVLTAPLPGTALEGVSLQVTLEIAAALELMTERRRLKVQDLERATEIWLTSTPSCALPVSYFNSEPVGDGPPWPMYSRLLAGWNELAGMDIRAQATAGSSR